jgi:mercuric ion binding protein
MKTFNFFLAIAFTIFSISAQAQTTPGKTEAIKVSGNCEMCKTRIEKAAKKAGASTAIWDVDSKILSVTYNPAKASINNIEKSISTSGHDTEHSKASTDTYEKLPGCCHYERKADAPKA